MIFKIVFIVLQLHVLISAQFLDYYDDILQRFETINSDLQILENGFYRPIRYDPWGPPEECNVTKNSLDELKKAIETTLFNVSVINGGAGVTCDYDINTDPNLNCEETVKLIQCGLQHLQQGFVDASKNNVSYTEYKELQNVFNELQERYQKDLENVKQSVSEEYQKIIDGLKTQIQSLNDALMTALAKLRNMTIEVLALKVEKGDISGAINTWNELDNAALPDSVRRTYEICTNSGQNDNIGNLIEFLYLLPRSLFIDGYKILMKELEDHRRTIIDPTVILLAIACEDQGHMLEYKRHREETVNVWTKALNENDNLKLNRIYFLSDKYSSQVERQKVIEDIVPKIYSGLNSAASNDGFQKMSNFLDKLPTKGQKTEGYNAMIKRMIQVSNWDNINSIKLALKIKTAGLELGGSFPSSINNLVFKSSKCLLKNKRYNEYLYAVAGYIDVDRRRVLSWTPGTYDQQSYWLFKLSTDGGESGEAYFTIKSVYANEWFYAIDESYGLYDERRRLVATWRPGTIDGIDQFSWNFIPVNNGEYFLIKSKKYGEYFYADANDFFNSERRFVFTWRKGFPEGNHYEESQWSVIC